MTIQRETMSLKGGMECPADFSGDCHDQTQISQSEVSPVQNTASEESESQEAQNQERVNLVAPRDGPNSPAKSNKEKRSYAERENSSLAAQISDLQKQNTRLDAGKTKSEHDLVFLQGRFNRLEHEYSQLKLQKTGWAREKKALSEKISKIEDEKIKLESSNEVLETDKEKLRLGLREIELENADMRKRIKKSDNEKEKLKDGKAALEEQIIALNLNQTQLGSMITSLREDNRSLNVQLNTLQDEEQGMRADKNFLQSKLAEFNSARNKWVSTNNELLRRVGELQRENAQREEENMRLIDQCSGLVQEISGLRLQHSIDDDSALQEKFHSLHFAIRSWCCQIHDAKPLEKSAVFRQFPLGAPGSVCQLSYLADHEVNVLIACTWEWMIKLIFGSNNAETGYHDSPDLWLEEDMALCLHNLELRLQTQGKEGLFEWIRLTNHRSEGGRGMAKPHCSTIDHGRPQLSRSPGCRHRSEDLTLDGCMSLSRCFRRFDGADQTQPQGRGRYKSHRIFSFPSATVQHRITTYSTRFRPVVNVSSQPQNVPAAHRAEDVCSTSAAEIVTCIEPRPAVLRHHCGGGVKSRSFVGGEPRSSSAANGTGRN
jgi:hypothetical protein